MIEGVFRDGHPRATLTLPGAVGPLEIEFIVDTGFEGGLALPGRIARQLAGQPTGFRNRLLADGSLIRCPAYEIFLEGGEGDLLVEVLVIDSRPLLGTAFLQDYLLQVEMTEGGEVTAEPL